MEKKVYHYLDFLDSSPNLGAKKVLGKTLTVRREKKPLRCNGYSTRSKGSEIEGLLDRHEHIRDSLGKVCFFGLAGLIGFR